MKLASGADILDEYEKTPRIQKKWLEDEKTKLSLPITKSSGEVVFKWAHDSDPSLAENSPVGETEHRVSRKVRRAQEEATRVERKLANKRRRVSPQEQRNEEIRTAVERAFISPASLSLVIVETAEALLGSPEESLYKLQILFSLYKMLEEEEDKSRIFVSLGVIFRDILPGYRIQTHGKEEKKEVQHTKKIRKIWKYEGQLLEFYGRFLNMVKTWMKEKPRVALPVVCELLGTSPFFNDHCEVLLPYCVRYAGRADVPDDLRQCCRECIENILRIDPNLVMTLAVVQAVGKAAKETQFQLEKANRKNSAKAPPVTLTGSLLGILALIDFSSKENAAVRETQTIGDAGWAGVDEETKREWGAGRVHGDLKRFQRNEADILQELFVIYLRILRSSHLYSSEVVEGSLRGLGNLSLRVNVELVQDIFTELRKLLLGRTPHTTIGMLGVLCALKLLSNEGSKLQVDVSWICEALSKVIRISLPHLSVCPPSASHPKILTDGGSLPSSVDGAFAAHLLEAVRLIRSCRLLCDQGAGGQHSSSNNAQFLLLTADLVAAASNAEPSVGFAIVREVTNLMNRYPRLKSVVDPEGAVLSNLSEEVSIFWAIDLLGCQPDKRAVLLQKALLTFSSSPPAPKPQQKHEEIMSYETAIQEFVELDSREANWWTMKECERWLK